MVEQTFAMWVEPIAAQFREARAELVAVARATPKAAWSRPSPNEGWTYKDLLAHIAGDTDKRFLQALRAIVDRQAVDLATLRTGIDDSNARNVEERRGRTIDELITEIEADGEETQELLARFTAADEDWQPEGLTSTAGNALRGVSPGLVVREHLAQLRTASGGERMTTRTFAAWVEPIAARRRESLAELVELARSLPVHAWARPSPLDGWTYKDLLAHLAGDTGKTALQLLRSVAANERADQALFEQLGKDVDARNERDVAERSERSLEALIAEIESDSEEWDDLLARFGEEDKDRRQEGIPLSLGEALSASPGGHARGHLEQLRTALEVGR